MIKNKGVDIDDIGILSVFFVDGKIVSMSIDIVDGQVSTAMLSNAPTKYATPLYQLIDNINKYVIPTLPVVDESSKTMDAIRMYTDERYG